MVRTRVSNKAKRFTDFGPSMDGDEDGAHTPNTGDGDQSDDNFAAPEHDSDVSIHEEAFSEVEDDVSNISDEASIAGGAVRDLPRGRRPKPPPPPPKPGAPNYHELPVYPLDPRLPTRAYNGPLRRGARYGVLRNIMYGPDYSRVRLIWDLLERWASYPVLPPRFPPEHTHGVLPSPWVPAGFEVDRERDACRWYEAFWGNWTELPKSHLLLSKHGEKIVPQAAPLTVLLGPVDEQKEYEIPCGTGRALSESGLPVNDAENPDKTTTGWMFDVGGLVIGMGWAPIPTGDKQIVALAVVPHSDQVRHTGTEDTDVDGDRNGGTIQFWQVTSSRDEEGRPHPSPGAPEFFLAKCFDWGRPRRMEWCPVSFTSAGIYGLLAVLCGDGKVRVLDVRATENPDTTVYEWVETPMATLGFADNYNVEVTCFTWLGANRLACGHTDGSITLWSVYPAQMLQRHAVHTSMVLDINSGYPSQPNMIASIPVGGFTSLIDLSNPSSEYTYVNSPGINFQPNVLDWSDHLQGWLALSPAGGPGLNTLAFLHVRYFPLPRPMLTSMSMPLCLSMGSNHGYGLVGGADGSVWSFNALNKLFRQREEDAFKIKILEHEFRPPDAWVTQPPDGMEVDDTEHSVLARRGASRIMQGFLPEVNDDPRSERLRVINKERRDKASKRKKGKTAKRPKLAEFIDDEDGDADGNSLEDISAHMASRMVIHEPLTRVAAVAWNPNVDYGTWAAVAFGSGLVRVMDVGVE